MQKLILVRGLPGSGKSTFAQKFLIVNIHHWEADKYFITNGEYKFDASKLHRAHQWCRGSTRNSLQDGFDVVVSNTFTQLWEMQPYLDMAKVLDVEVRVYTMKTQYENIHRVPEETIKRMKQRWEPYEGEIFIGEILENGNV